MAALRWDLFCRVIDNFGDIGVCWRLAAQLAARGERVRLVVDDASALDWMAPEALRRAIGRRRDGPAAGRDGDHRAADAADADGAGAAGTPGDIPRTGTTDPAAAVEVLPWPGPAEPGDVVIEAFGCDPPPAFVAAMAAAGRAPVWINLEHLSAEPFVERSHGLPSPQRNGLVKWFFFPGFTPRTGGLLREPGLLEARATFGAAGRAAWLAGQGVVAAPGERVASLFCYDNAALPGMLEALAARPTLLLLTPGPAQRQVTAPSAGVRLHRLPWLDQPGFDRLLWSCELNFVRGEDSLVRAIWAGAPFVWQAYPQHDGAHWAKVDAMLERLAPPPAVARLWRTWNGAGPFPGWPTGDGESAWADATRRWRAELAAQPDLASQLAAFARAKRAAA